MSNTSSTTLSNKRVIITLCIYILVPIVAHLLNFLLQQYDISLMFSLNLATAILVMYNWNLFALHYNRAKQNLADALLYSILAFFLIGIWTYISNHFLKCIVIMPSKTVLIQYGYARIGMLIAYSFSEATLISIVEKVATDHINVKHHELQVIMLSGFLLPFYFFQVKIFSPYWLHCFIMSFFVHYFLIFTTNLIRLSQVSLDLLEVI